MSFAFFKPSMELSALIGARGATGLALLAVYVTVCRVLRFRRRNKKHAEYPYKTREDFSKMTATHAWEIYRYVASLEFPFLHEKALQFALFRTYGIPTISTLLSSTRQLAAPQLAPRRYEDTALLIAEFLVHPPSHPRSNEAIARMNYLHSIYQRAGKISNDDMLYTMSLFVLEPTRWIASYEWRSMTDMEICALATLWKTIGDAQGINFSALQHGPNDFRDGLEFYEDLRTWADEYENRAMVPDKHNHLVAEETTALLVCNIPTFLRPVARNFVVALMDERLRKAMVYEPVLAIHHRLVDVMFAVRRFVSLYLFPPRPYFLRLKVVSESADPKSGRYFKEYYEQEPWYVKPTFWNRYSVSSWVRWATGRPYPGCSDKFKPEGYQISKVGPQKFEDKGSEECEVVKKKLMEGRAGVECPFAVRR
ncbi:hypothetical protein M011DRAFT_425006 [Sporormia fimetaria CBS 119925]|uniref:Uncharacterized protein n=1 Tax=Sporormia fimetaria CBS 119925 TaxID=1340428 RepID=A0A6A6V9J4_9PLEO|nr:hypothetical protein M011DRAFT_425006 [Sporormia fimetaria CBS 119925]